MKYYRNELNGYIISIFTGCGEIEITKEEYDNIMNLIKNRPIAEDGYVYILKTDLTWELIEVETKEEEPTMEEYAEVGKILLGVSE